MKSSSSVQGSMPRAAASPGFAARAARVVAATLLAAVTSAAPLVAQDDAPPRRPLAGVVQDPEGAPVAGARVQLAGALATPLWNLPPDVVEATTDERGRFRVMVRECVEYTAWAALAGSGDAATRVSALHTGVVPGPRLDLVLAHDARTTLPVRGAEPWRDRADAAGALSARLWLDGGSGYFFDAPVRRDDGAEWRVELPAAG